MVDHDEGLPEMAKQRHQKHEQKNPMPSRNFRIFREFRGRKESYPA
jgi:hypothetical protein